MLTDRQLKAVKPGDRPFRLTDGGGLHLFVTPAGGRLWRMRYEFGGKEKLLSFGAYPDVSLIDARKKREEARGLLAAGRDPSLVWRHGKAQARDPGRTLEAVARQWHERLKPGWTERHAWDVLNSLERDVFPEIGAMPLTDITAPVVLDVLRTIERRPAVETAHRIRQRLSAIFVYAIASGLADTDPAAIVKGAMTPVRKGRQPAVVDLAQAREVLATAEETAAHPGTKLGLRLLALTAVRPGEIRGALWTEMEGLDGPAPLWRIPAERMKMKREHLVPLSQQAIEVVEAMRRLTGRGPLLFPSSRHAHRPMSENAMGYLLNRAGFHGHHVPHGWRAAFSTVMNERHRADRAVIDLMLAHVPKDKVEAAYNRALHMERRRELAQEWADLLLHGARPAAAILTDRRR